MECHKERNCFRKGGETKSATKRIMAKANPKPDIHVWCFRGVIDVVSRNYSVFKQKAEFQGKGSNQKI